jgi:hypothetical protein
MLRQMQPAQMFKPAFWRSISWFCLCGLCNDSGGKSPVYHHWGTGSIPVQCCRDLWLTKCVRVLRVHHVSIGRFHPFYRPRRPLGIVEVKFYSVFRPWHQKGVRGQPHAPAAYYPRERPGTHCTGGWVGPRAGLDGCGNSCPHRDSIPGPSIP